MPSEGRGRRARLPRHQRRPGACTIEDLASTVLHHVQTAAIAVAEDGRVGVYNPAAERLLGVPRAEVLGRDVHELSAMATPLAPLADALAAARQTGETAARRQVEVDTPRGRRTFGYTVSRLGGGGASALFFADLTEALAEERRAAEAQRFAEVGRIASAMAHELKSPLATVELYVNLLRRALADRPDLLEMLDVVKDQTRLCLERIGAIMHSINPDAARAAGMRLTEVVPVVERVVADQRRRFDGGRVTLRVDGALVRTARVALAEGDLRSVVSNLVVNAFQATAGKGPVAVSVRGDGEQVRIVVADRGPGLPEGDVFRAFYTTKPSGTGLGLWLVRRLVEGAGGRIEAGDRRGGGAVFTVTLPLPRHERLRGARVLIVEDDAALRRASVAALAGQGAEVTAAGSAADLDAVLAAGQEATATSRTWDCAVLDFHLPGGNGVDLARRLPAEVPVLVVSGDPAAGAAVAGLEGRRAWFLPKPFEVGIYLDLLSLLVRAR